MPLAIVNTRAREGIEAPPVTVEVHLTNGLPSFSIVGLPETAVKESKDRVRSALINSEFEFPTRRITVNLAPADLPKEGGRYDLAIALGVLCASGQLPQQALTDYEFIGELALSGELRPVPGVLPAALRCRDVCRALILPLSNLQETVLIKTAQAYGAEHLLDVCNHLLKKHELTSKDTLTSTPQQPFSGPDLSEVRGQHQAKRALEVAAAGGHNLLFVGPPGTGKSMLASRLPGLLPPLQEAQLLEVAAIRSVSEVGWPDGDPQRRPFRAPHHTASGVALVGGGSMPRPGEISLAHQGVLFLDELPEFDRRVLEVLREPMESGEIRISRAARQVCFPARFQLIAAMNPCPCGYHGEPSGRCRCSTDQIARYQGRISGPLLDRIDIQIEVPSLPAETLTRPQSDCESSLQIRERIIKARKHQYHRRSKENALLNGDELEQDCSLDNASLTLITHALDRLGLSARAYHRILRVARTLADLEGQESISRHHLLEALNYRKLERLR